LHMRHGIRPFCVAIGVFRCAGRAGQPHRDRQGDRESRTETDFTEAVVFRFHNFVFHYAVLCFVSLLKDYSMVRFAAAHAEDGDEDDQRH
jgi:hypothetical protein